MLNLLSEVIGSAIHFAQKLNDNDLLYLATHDSLTDLANRSLFMDRLHLITQNSLSPMAESAVLMIDLNGLKGINDHFGHNMGDKVLQEVAKRLRNTMRKNDIVARIGGDEFAVLLSPIEDKIFVATIIDRIHQKLRDEFVLEDQTFHLTASVGYSIYKSDAQTPIQLMQIADQRMYSEKHRFYEIHKRDTL